MLLTALLTVRRLRAHGLILAFCLWSVYLWNISTSGLFGRAGNLKGTDFLHFYTLGSLALAHRGADLYDLQAQAALVAQRVPGARDLLYLPLYPPQLSLFFAPFAMLSYPSALALWLSLSSLTYLLCCFAILRACPNLRSHRSTVIILALAFPAFWHLIAWGQTSALALACFTAAYFALRAQREFLAGLAFGCLIFKPQLALAAAFVFVFTFRWKIVFGAIVSAAAHLLAAWIYYGPGPFGDWTHVLLNIPTLLPLLEPRIYQTHSLRTFWAMLIPWPSVSLALCLITSTLVAALTVICWRSHIPLSLQFSALLFATVLLSPHLTVYDLVIVAPAILLISDRLVGDNLDRTIAASLKLLLYLAFLLPLFGPLTRWTHFQLSVPVMFAILYEIWNLGRQSNSVPD
jgi:hypothetical protein